DIVHCYLLRYLELVVGKLEATSGNMSKWPRKYYERKQLHFENLVEWKQKVHVEPWWRRVVEDEVRWRRRVVEEEGWLYLMRKSLEVLRKFPDDDSWRTI
ncbi:hypothetical protein Tco_1086900, partial [Tanacetum coccineum]